MPEPFIQLGSATYHTYTILLGLFIVGGAGVGVLVLRRVYDPGRVLDAYLLILIAALIGARIEHVLLHWDYFANAPAEITNLNTGGLNWHGAVLAGLLGLALAARWRKFDAWRLRDSLTLVLPLLAFGAWWGCGASHCAYGREVTTLADYPAWVAAETADVYGIVAPRYNTQPFGMLLALLVLGVTVLLMRRDWLPGCRFWLVLALLSAGALGIGFFRDDPMPLVVGLRADQWLDTGMLGWALFLGKRSCRNMTSLSVTG